MPRGGVVLRTGDLAASADRRGASAAVGEPRGGILPLAGFFGFGVEVQDLLGLERALLRLGPLAVAVALAGEAAPVLAFEFGGGDGLALHFAPPFGSASIRFF